MIEASRERAEPLREMLFKINEQVLKMRHPWSRVFSPNPEIWDVLKRSKPHFPVFGSDYPIAVDSLRHAASLNTLAEFCLTLSGMEACSVQRASFPSPNRLLLSTVKRFHSDNGTPRKFVLIPEGESRKWSEAADLAGYTLVPIRLTAHEWVAPITKAIEKYGRDLAAFAFTFPNPSFAFPRDFPNFYETLHSLNILLVVDARYSQSLLGQINSNNLGLDLLLWDESTFSGDRFPPSQSLGIYLARGSLSRHLPSPLLSRNEAGQNAWTESHGSLFPYGLPYRETEALLAILEGVGVDTLKEKSGELALRRRFLREQLTTDEKPNDDTSKFFEPLPAESQIEAKRRYAPYDFFAKVRGNESLDRLNSFLSGNKQTGKPIENQSPNKAGGSRSVSFAELDFSNQPG